MECNFRRGGHLRPLTRGVPILLFLLVVITAGCAKSALQRSIVMSDEQVSPRPLHTGPITVNFKLADASKPVTHAQVSLEGDMTHAGMAPVFGDAHELSPGQYEGQLTLSMGGDWVVLMHITLPDGKKAEEQMNLPGVQSK